MGMGARSERVRLFVLFVLFWHCRMSSWKVFESLYALHSCERLSCPRMDVRCLRPRPRALTRQTPDHTARVPRHHRSSEALGKDNTIEDHWCSVVVGAPIDRHGHSGNLPLSGTWSWVLVRRGPDFGPRNLVFRIGSGPLMTCPDPPSEPDVLFFLICLSSSLYPSHSYGL